MTKLDDMLSKWPMAERPQLEADEAAERVVAAIEGGQLPASIDETLLAPPLPKTAEEGSTTSTPPSRAPGRAAADRPASPGRAGGISGVENKMSKDRTRDRTSFQELAKMASTPPPPTSVPPSAGGSASASGSGPAAVVRGKEADSSDSGIVDLKMVASADPSGAQRAQTTPLAAEGLFDDEPAAGAKGAEKDKPAAAAKTAEKTSTSGAPAPAAAQAVPQPVASAKKAVAGDEKKGGGGVFFVIGAVVVAGAIAAGALLYLKHSHETAVATHTPSAPDTVAAAAQTTQPGAGAPSATAAAASSVAALTADDLPTVDQNGKPVAQAVRVHPHHATTAPAESASAAPPPATSVAPNLVANVPTGPAGAASGDLASAMKMAAGGGTGLGGGQQPTNQGPKYAPGTVPDHPSQGQVIGAVGAVMDAARACLPGGVPVSHGTIVFQSDGTVKSVSITGYAAGKPAEACVRTALKKAKVDPFAQATYTVPVSIRASQ